MERRRRKVDQCWELDGIGSNRAYQNPIPFPNLTSSHGLVLCDVPGPGPRDPPGCHGLILGQGNKFSLTPRCPSCTAGTILTQLQCLTGNSVGLSCELAVQWTNCVSRPTSMILRRNRLLSKHIATFVCSFFIILFPPNTKGYKCTFDTDF